METKILSGKELAESVLGNVKKKIDTYVSKGKRPPGLAVLLVGDDPASKIYVSKKQEACERVGIKSFSCCFPSDTRFEVIKGTIEELNEKDEVDGILLQLPLPDGLREKTLDLLYAIDPSKDVDGFHPYNVGLVSIGDKRGIQPCTPKGVMYMLDHYGIDVEGKNITMVGASNIVGKPMAVMLVNRMATVSICHIKTRCVEEFTKNADIVISATGVPHLIKRDMVKEGAVIIDVGISRLNGKIVGDVDFEGMLGHVAAITPVPGGVGPMTVAMLMENTLECYVRREVLHS
ncbi:methylenetetrahydrofolate dehydrogenase (NADP+)/methenyltetrahydrofolate cyclohydrolase [Thermosulfidibacter takaii ABI70S6]|uniref:Bifunctional protein FolD n=1 Tax=Thermosulfidibacter takaii (strain DSM 17441 / JCM 13301 / NBRC 103674 / ABI70S6) TaxID=1298851 RepID=A0A0S3QT56_THET7|nr:bifunctional methylenetetrahydrofolate dehydrogenase/methenyltetrahydrofolate cyclohydrolase FolD [Thermosulfidibacter takaii]BAT71509.1 methylenetetrahydrofolate dehydrogenase (NADP+)/methenyltetrahydrofolate cyclohydrolase [Thermosulfidibacter takaii ABI70S6]